MAGTNYQVAAGSWVASGPMGSPNQFNFMGTINNVFELFDVSLTEGSVAPPFQVPDVLNEMAMCMRYYERADTTIQAAGIGVTAFPYSFKAAKRIIPTMLTLFAPAYTNANTAGFLVPSANSVGLQFDNRYRWLRL
jgi:hypothetical protein